MTPLEKLLAEATPTGTFGGGPPTASSTAAVRPRRETPGADPHAAAHQAALLAALAEQPTVDHRVTRRHLRAVPDTAPEPRRGAA